MGCDHQIKKATVIAMASKGVRRKRDYFHDPIKGKKVPPLEATLPGRLFSFLFLLQIVF
jgi:hypothetical protein